MRYHQLCLSSLIRKGVWNGRALPGHGNTRVVLRTKPGAEQVGHLPVTVASLPRLEGQRWGGVTGCTGPANACPLCACLRPHYHQAGTVPATKLGLGGRGKAGSRPVTTHTWSRCPLCPRRKPRLLTLACRALPTSVTPLSLLAPHTAAHSLPQASSQCAGHKFLWPQTLCTGRFLPCLAVQAETIRQCRPLGQAS